MAADSIKFDMPRDYTKNYEVFYSYESELPQNGLNGIHNGICNGIDRNNNKNDLKDLIINKFNGIAAI